MHKGSKIAKIAINLERTKVKSLPVLFNFPLPFDKFLEFNLLRSLPKNANVTKSISTLPESVLRVLRRF